MNILTRSFQALPAAAFLLLLAFPGHTQTRILEIQPDRTGAGIEAVHGPHLAVYEPGAGGRQPLILMIVGTGGHAANSRSMDSIFAEMGYHVLALDYRNQVITTTCSGSSDSACFDGFRQEIVTGEPVSDIVRVDSVNSLLNRFISALRYLDREDPGGQWGRYLRGGRPRWRRIITAGHSQGAGHAAYLGKLFRVRRVLMFSGPQDYLDLFHRPAGWQGRKGATPPSRYFAFLHVKDPFNVQHQIANDALLMGLSASDTLMVQPGEAVQGQAQILVNDISTRDPHSSTLLPVFRPVWRYMLGRR